MTEPKNSNNRNNNYELVVPTSNDFHGLTRMKQLAFAEKGVSDNDEKKYQTYLKKYPNKIEHCRVVKSSDHPDVILGAIQLQLKGDPGDLGFPAGFRHEVMNGEAYIEFIACHPDHSGKGIGSKLLAWADQFAIEQGCSKLSLEVMTANDGAIRLYERKGYVVMKDPHMEDECDACIGSLFVYCCLGCKYWSLVYMEKQLPKRSDVAQIQGGADAQTSLPSATTSAPQHASMVRDE